MGEMEKGGKGYYHTFLDFSLLHFGRQLVLEVAFVGVGELVEARG